MYVVYWVERMRDGDEEGAKVVRTQEDALELIEKYANHGIGGCNTNFRLFELGKEILLNREVVKEPLPVVVKEKTKFSVVPDQADPRRSLTPRKGR